MKKTIKTMLAAMLIAALLPVMPAMADGAVAALTQNPELIPESPLFSDSCDATSGFYINGGLAPSTALDNAGNSVLKLTRTTDDFRFWKWVDSQSSTLNSADGIVYQFDFYTASNATNWDSSGLFVYSRGHDDGGNDTNLVSLRPNPSDPAAVQIIRNNKNGKVLASFSADAWHTLAFAITHESGSTSYSYDIYVDGVLTVEGETFTLGKDNMHFFGFRTDNWWWAEGNATGDEYFIDNVYAYAGPALTAFIPEPEKTSYSIDLTSIYNMSTWAYWGDTVSDPSKFYTDAVRGAMAMNDDSQTSYSLASEGVTFEFDRSLFHADTMNAYFGERNETVTIGGHAKYVKNIYIIASNRFNGYDSYTVKIDYKDGSSETQLLPITVLNQKDSNEVMWNELPSYAGVYQNGERWGHMSVENGKVVSVDPGVDARIPIWKFAADPSKEIDTVSITGTGSVGLALFGMAETVMTTDDMKSVIAQAKALDYVKDTTDAALVKKAAVFARELYEREAATLEENQKVFDLLKQAEAQETKYLDLSDIADVDLIVKENDTRLAGYEGRDILLHKAGPSEITLVAPDDSNYIDPMTGTKFKLSGGYEGNGNDAVAVEKDGSGVAFAPACSIYKEISFLIDAVYPEAEQVNYKTGNTVDFVIYFADGTTKEVTTEIFRSDSWYSSQHVAHYRNPSLYYDGSKYADGRGITDPVQVTDDLYTAFGTKITEIKPIESVELVAPSNYSYNVFAVTAVPVTNEALVALADAFVDSGITDPSEVNAANAQDVADQTSAIVELYNRGYDVFGEEDVELAEELHSEALMYLLDDGVLNFVPSVSAAGGNVTASVNMMNTTISNKNYVLIVAAYDENGKLVALNATAQKTLAAGTSSASDSVSVAAPANAASYKAIVWDSINSMIPIAVASR